MLTVSKTSISLRIANENATIIILKKGDEFHFEQTFHGEKKEVKQAMLAHQTLKNALVNTNKKASYEKRFSKLATFILGTNAKSFRVLNNRLEKICTETIDA